MNVLDRNKSYYELKNTPVMTKRMRGTLWYACELFGTTAREVLKTKSRRREVADAKKCFAMTLVKNHWFSAELPKENELSIITISRLLNLNHATVIYYKATFDGLYKTDKSFAEKFDRVMENYNTISK